MTRNTEYEITLFEIIKLLIRKWKLVCIVMIVCIALCGGYKAVTSSNSTQEIPQNDNYEQDAELYEYLSGSEENYHDYLVNEWKNISYDRQNNPVFSVDPYNCKYEQIVVHFESEDSNGYWTVSNWVLNADDDELFGAHKKELSDYKSSLVLIGKDQGSETVVQLIAVDGFDVIGASDYLKKIFKQSAKEEGFVIKIESASAKGYNEWVERYQQNNRDKYNSIFSAFTNSKTMISNIATPSNPAGTQNNTMKSVLKFCLVGLILGFILAAVYILFDVVRKREIVSARQVGDAFDLELLGDCSADNEVSIDVLNANLDVMTEGHNTIAVVTETNIGSIDEIASEWTKKSDRKFIFCSDIFDDPESIEGLKKARNIVIGIKIGKSKLGQIQRILLRANKLNLNVLGFVLL